MVYKRLVKVVLICLIILMFSGCQSSPKNSIVASKNDGSFEEAIKNTPSPTIEPASGITVEDRSRLSSALNTPYEQAESSANPSVLYENTFTNSSGTIKYSIQIAHEEGNDALPVIQVRPHEITIDQAKKIAEALFGTSDMFRYTDKMTRGELEEQILYLRQKTNDRNELLEECDGDEAVFENLLSYYESLLAVYEEDYLTAVDEIELEKFDWQFHPLSYFYESFGEDIDAEYDGNYIVAAVESNGLPYIYRICNKNSGDYYIHSIYAYVDGERVSLDDVSSTVLPSEDAIEDGVDHAKNLLLAMGMDNWVVNYSKTEEFILPSGRTGYRVVVKASPSYEGIPVIRQPQIMNIKGGDEFAANYYYEDIIFEFSQGVLTSFEYQAPLEEVGVVNSDVSTLSFDGVINAFEEHLKYDELSAFALPHLASVEASVTEVEFGLSRSRIKDNRVDYYLIPAYTFRGKYIAYDSNHDIITEGEKTFAVINAVDGSIINTQIGY